MRKVQQLALKQEMEAKTEAFEKELREKERQAAETVVEQNFSDLRRYILEELEHLETRFKGVALTREEEEHRMKLLRELREAENAIEKKIKDIT